jgi:hypothetical protein
MMMWQPIETAPKDQFLLLCGPSGYTTTPMVVTSGRMCSDYHAGRWIDHANDDLTEWGFEPTHWMPLPDLPGAQPAPSALAEAIIADMQAQYNSEMITENDSGEALIRLDGAIAAVEDNFAQPAPSIPEGWLRAIDEALVVAHIGVANESDTFEQAREKLDNLIGFHVDVASDPAVNGGWKLVPIEPTETFYQCFSAYDGTSYSNPFDYDDFVKDWREALAAAPEAKP